MQTISDGAIIDDDEISYASELEPDHKPNLQVEKKESNSENEESDFQSETFGSEVSRKKKEEAKNKDEIDHTRLAAGIDNCERINKVIGQRDHYQKVIAGLKEGMEYIQEQKIEL